MKNERLSNYTDLDIEFLDRGVVHPESFIGLLKHQLSRFAVRTESKVNDMADLWELFNNVRKYSYWVLLVNGVDVDDDKEIINEIAIWEKMLARCEAAFLASLPSDNQFSFICSCFELCEFPVLMVSNVAEMKPNIKIGPNALKRLLEAKDGLRKMLIKIHIQLKSQTPVTRIKNQIRARDYWDWFRMGVDEFRDFLQFIT